MAAMATDCAIAALAMIAILILWLRLITVIPPWIFVLGGITVAGLMYVLTTIVLRVPEIQSLVQLLKSRIR